MKLSTFNTLKTMKSAKGTYIKLTQEQIEAYQVILLSIFDDIMMVCLEHDIPYSICGGTALGALRHHGFIPWDDDLDIEIPRRYFDRFLKSFQEQLGEKYWVHIPDQTPNYCLMMAKIRKKGTVVKTLDDLHNEECGAFVDVFFIDNTFNNALLRKLHGASCIAMNAALSCIRFYRDRSLLLEMAEKPDIHRVFWMKVQMGRFLSILPIRLWTRMANWSYRLCKNDNSTYVTVPPGRKRFFGEMFLRSEREKTRSICFEQRTCPIAADIETILSSLYGDYMSIPTPEQRERHILLRFEI